MANRLAQLDLKPILHSKRANVYYLEYCRVMQKDGRILYLTEAEKENLYYNIPIANTTVILLGTGTSVTQAAMRMLSSAGVLVGFCGGGATPLFSGTEIEWLCPQSEYRPTEYVQAWLSWWFDEKKRLCAAKQFQQLRARFIEQVWSKDSDLRKEGFDFNDDEIADLFLSHHSQIEQQNNVSHLLQLEARLTKKLYRLAVNKTQAGGFSRDYNAQDKANVFLNHGNYLAYGLAATTAWVLGIPHGFAVMHGKTRRGALVFDIADLVKDALILPQAFISAKYNEKEQDFRQSCIHNFVQHKALDTMFNAVKSVAMNVSNEVNKP